MPSKIFERVIYNQLGEYTDLFLNKLLCGFRKAHSTHNVLFKLLHIWQKELDNSGSTGSILMDPPKVYDCLPHDLIIAKKNSIKLLLDHLAGRKQLVKIGSSCSFWPNVKKGIPQGFILEPLLFNVSINDQFMFIENCEICNLAHDNTFYSGEVESFSILENLKHDMKIILKWFRINLLKANPGKFRL